MNSIGAGRQRQRSRFGVETFTSSFERLRSIVPTTSQASELERLVVEIFLPQLDEMYAPG